MKRLPTLLLAFAAGLLFLAAAGELAGTPKGTAAAASWSGASAPEPLLLKTAETGTVSVPHVLLPNPPVALSLAAERSQPLLRHHRSEAAHATALFARPPPVSLPPCV